MAWGHRDMGTQKNAILDHWSPGSLGGALRVPVMRDMKKLLQEI